MTANMKPQGGRSIEAPSLRGLWGRSATGLNGRAAAKKEVSAVWSGGWMPENISGVLAGRSVFHLTSPLIGLLNTTLGRLDLSSILVKKDASPSSGPAPIIVKLIAPKRLASGHTAWSYSTTLRATLTPGYTGLHK